MPLLVTPTTIDVLQAAFVAALHGLEPRMQRSQVEGWKYYSRKHDPLIGARWFRFEWTPHGEDLGIQTNAVFVEAMDMLLVVDYGGLPDQEVDAIANDDWFHVEGTLDALRPTVGGLRRVKRGTSWDYTDETEPDRAQIGLLYTVHYVQAKS